MFWNKDMAFADTFVGQMKTEFDYLAEINAKVDLLNHIVLNENSQDFRQGLSAIRFQQNVYQNFKDFSTTAFRISLLITAGLTLAGVAKLISTYNENMDSRFSADLSFYGSSLAVIGSLYDLYHYVIEGKNVVERNKRYSADFKNEMTKLNNYN